MAFTIRPASGINISWTWDGFEISGDSWEYSSHTEPLPANSFTSGGKRELGEGFTETTATVGGIWDLDNSPSDAGLKTGATGEAIFRIDNIVFATCPIAFVSDFTTTANTNVLTRYTVTLQGDFETFDFSGVIN